MSGRAWAWHCSTARAHRSIAWRSFASGKPELVRIAKGAGPSAGTLKSSTFARMGSRAGARIRSSQDWMTAFVRSPKLLDLISYRTLLTVPHPATASAIATPIDLFMYPLKKSRGTPFTAGARALPDGRGHQAALRKNGSPQAGFLLPLLSPP